MQQVEFDEDGTIVPIVGNYEGVPQRKNLDPYRTLEAETIGWQSGILTRLVERGSAEFGPMATNSVLTELNDGDWTALSAVDFGEHDEVELTALASPLAEGAAIEVRAGATDGTLLGTIELDGTLEEFGEYSTTLTGAAGVHDVFFVFTGADDEVLAEVDTWTFAAEGDVEEPASVEFIEVTQLPTKTEYMVGDELDLGGLEVTATRTDNETSILTDGEFTVTGFASSAPATVMLVVTYDEDPSITTSFNVTVAEEPAALSFRDVRQGQTKFYEQIMWLAGEGISRGWTTSQGQEFRPYEDINRDAIAAFLYRYAGSPDVTMPARSPFVDVSPQTQFYKEIVWMHQEGISTGWSTSRGQEFRPYEPINRDAMAAFLYRFAGKPSYTAPSVSPFKDISPSKQFYKEIAWMRDAGISTGWTGGAGKPEFRPFANTNRDAMAAFLYRFDRNVAD